MTQVARSCMGPYDNRDEETHSEEFEMHYDQNCFDDGYCAAVKLRIGLT